MYTFKTIQWGIQKTYNTKYGKDFPSMEELTANSVFVLTNSEPLIDFARPTLHKVVDIGGIGIREPHKLNTKNMMKIERRTRKDISDDPRLTAFVTHGGMGSIQEATARGVPLLVIPLFADQSRNAQIIQKYGMGQMLAKTQLADKHTLIKKLHDVVHNKKTRENARRIAKMLAKRPFSSRDKLIKHIEFACKFGELPQLNPVGRQLNFVQYYLIDIILIFVVVASVLLTTLIYVSMLLLRFFNSKKIKTPSEEIAHWKMAKRSINNYWLNRKRMLNLENDSLERPSLPKRRYAGPEDEELANQSDEYAFD
uniref:glucuronosyltransferase n=1 Tax=Heterorhabditis bacteriophora TaxID=37862 RepID=A0A1I7WQ66_HETBA